MSMFTFMVRRGLRLLAVVALALGTFSSGTAVAAGPVSVYTGSIDSAAYKIEKPANWNGTLVLYSHGFVVPGSSNPAQDVGDGATGAYLLDQGYALAGSAYKGTGWAVKDALVDQIALLDYFDENIGKPKRTIAWGHSLGGLITAGLVQQNPERFAGALPMCGVLAGGVGAWNSALDGEFVFRTLLAPPNSTLQLVHITNPLANLGQAEAILAAAQGTLPGRARLALVAAMGDVPGWFSALTAEPAASDFTSREANQFLWDQQTDFPLVFAFRAEMEFRAGGNPSWNTGVNYRQLLDKSINKDEVQALYTAAGLNLDQDLATLAATPRISADRPAVGFLVRNIVFNGEFEIPELTLHTTGDGEVVPQNEQAYASIADNRNLLRQMFVHRAGHCTFTPAETIAAFNALVQRIDTHKWSGLSPAELNAAAVGLGALNIAPPAYVDFTPTVFLRPFSLNNDGGERNREN